MNCLFGTTSSLRSQSVMVVERMRMREICPVVFPTVTTSPTRTGCSKRMIRPEMKFAKISCRPNPRPTVNPAASHCTLDQVIPSIEKPATRPPITRIHWTSCEIAYFTPRSRPARSSRTTSMTVGMFREA